MKALLSIALFFMCASGFSQDTFLQNSNPQLEKQAEKIADLYNNELSLTSKQQMLFQKKVEEFLIRRDKIEKSLTGTEKLKVLFEMQQQETAEMNDILTRPQLVVYKKMKPQIQPVETIEKE